MSRLAVALGVGTEYAVVFDIMMIIRTLGALRERRALHWETEKPHDWYGTYTLGSSAWVRSTYIDRQPISYSLVVTCFNLDMYPLVLSVHVELISSL
jgi:hypothetical protein